MLSVRTRYYSLLVLLNGEYIVMINAKYCVNVYNLMNVRQLVEMDLFLYVRKEKSNQIPMKS